MVRVAILLSVLLVSACGGSFGGQGTVPSYRQPFVNSSANSEPQPAGSMPR